MTKEQIQKRAQAKANHSRKPVVILNLNPYSPLYVIRDYIPAPSFTDNVVSIHHPELDLSL